MINDSFINALNTQRATNHWIDAVSENLFNIYTPGYRESQNTFKTFLNGSVSDTSLRNVGQGKSMPGTSNENVYLEGAGFFVLRNEKGRIAYTRLGEFKFDAEGIYKSVDGQEVQGYILNDKGEIMQGTKSLNADIYEDTAVNGGVCTIPTTSIKLWIDPNNGKYLGKYDEFEVKGDGILYGKADGGRVMTPLYKIAVMNFHNSQELFEVKQGQYIETEESGKPVIGRGEIRSGLIEMSNVDYQANIAYYKQAKMQIDVTNKLIQTNKQLLQQAIDLMSQ